MEEYLPGYYIKYDGFRDRAQYTVLTPEGRFGDAETLDKAMDILALCGGYYGSTISCKIHYPLHGNGNKWYIAKYKNTDVCVMVEYTDGNCIVDLGGELGLDIVHKKDLK